MDCGIGDWNLYSTVDAVQDGEDVWPDLMNMTVRM